MPRFWPTGGLWRHGDFLKLWSAETISQFGSQAGQLALPLVAILVLDASAFEVAVLGDGGIPPLHHLHAARGGVGRPTSATTDPHRRRLRTGRAPDDDPDRVRRRRALPRPALRRRVPGRRLPGLLRRRVPVVLPSLVEREQIIEGNSKLEISRSAAQVAGPGFGGALVQILTAPWAVFADALSFVGSGLFVLRIRKVEDAVEVATVDGRKVSLWTDLKEGLGFVLGNPNLRAQAGCTATSNFFSSLAFSIFLVFAVRELHLSAGTIGLIFSVGAAGSLVAAFTSMRISARFGIGPTSIVMAAMFGPTFLLVAAAPVGNAAIPVLVSAQLVFGFTVVVYNIVQVSYRQAICPPRLQGRMNSVMRFMVWGTIPLGTLAGGALATWIGLRETIVVGAVGGASAFLWLLFSPQRHLHEMPEPVDDSAGLGPVDVMPEPASV